MIDLWMLLLSIRSRFADAIYSGAKRFEFRRLTPRRSIPGLALIYETLPVGMVTGIAHVASASSLTPEGAARVAGSDDPFANAYEGYLQGAMSPCALALVRPRRFTAPIGLTQLTNLRRPPQSFAYVEVDSALLTALLPPESCHSTASAFADGTAAFSDSP
jgi:predicted transcriptional regulator